MRNAHLYCYFSSEAHGCQLFLTLRDCTPRAHYISTNCKTSQTYYQAPSQVGLIGFQDRVHSTLGQSQANSFMSQSTSTTREGGSD